MDTCTSGFICLDEKEIGGLSEKEKHSIVVMRPKLKNIDMVESLKSVE